MNTTGLQSKGMNVPRIYEEHMEILVLTISDLSSYQIFFHVAAISTEWCY